MRLAAVRRQWQVLAFLRAYGGVTLDRLARETDVTTRTIRRDLEALESLYFPITTAVYDDGVKRWRLMSGAACPACGHAPRETATRREQNAIHAHGGPQ